MTNNKTDNEWEKEFYRIFCEVIEMEHDAILWGWYNKRTSTPDNIMKFIKNILKKERLKAINDEIEILRDCNHICENFKTIDFWSESEKIIKKINDLEKERKNLKK